MLAIDSIQTVYTADLDSIPGSLAQVRECAGRLMHFAKRSGTLTIPVGHVKEARWLAPDPRAPGRRGAAVRGRGRQPVPGAARAQEPVRLDPGARRLRDARHRARRRREPVGDVAERPVGAPGSVVVASADGARPFRSRCRPGGAGSAGVGRRTAAGVDGNRLALLLAVLAQRAGCDVLSQDVFVNVAGGLRLSEPAVDLGVACAVASSARGRAVEARTIVFGEVGLAGEVRAVPLCDLRLLEARRLGFTRAILPMQNQRQLDPAAAPGMTLVGVERLADALAAL
ncbi:MAG: magnesium chelatase domain-containing protein [Kofleriaceae bacterium]